MTFKNTSPMSFGKIFAIFWKYWDYVSKRGTEYTALEVLEVLVGTNVLFMHLRSEWEKVNWDIEELKYICAVLDNGCEDLNLNYFIDCKFAYLEHLKTYYYLENIG